MNTFLLSTGIKLFLAVLLIFGAYYVVEQSHYYYLFIANVFLISSLAFLVEALFSFFFFLSTKLAKHKVGILSTSRSTFIVLFIADVIIRLSGLMQTYPERVDGNYFSIAQQEKLDSWYWIHTPNTTISNQKKEFLFKREVNSIGISEKEISKDKGSKFRILAIGDSFTEGVGTDYEDSWVKQMEFFWKEKNIESINGGIGGSDPVYSFVLYRDKLTKYNPDLVVLTINATDVADIIGRGGFERFHTDGIAGKESPSWEWIYAANHLFRLVMNAAFGYNSSLVKNSNSPEAQQKSVDIIKETLSRLKGVCVENNAKLLVVIHPSIQEFNNGKHTPFFGQKELIAFMKKAHINFLDVTPAFEAKGKSISDYYYPIDTHFNHKGYALFGNTVYKRIDELGFIN